MDNPNYSDPKMTGTLTQTEKRELGYDQTGSDGGPRPGMCKGGDLGWAAKKERRGSCCHSSLKVSAITRLVSVCCVLL